MAMTRTPPGMIILLTASICVTALFAVFLFKEAGRVADLQGQSGESIKNSVPGTKSEINQLQTGIAKKREQEALLLRERRRLDGELAKYRIFMTGEDIHSGMATTSFTNAADGKALTTNNAIVSKSHVQQANARLETQAASVASDGWQKMPDMENLISKRQDQLASLQKHISDLDVAFKDDEDKLKTQLEKQILARDQAVKKHNEDNSTRLTKIGKLEVEIRKLLGLELRWLTEIEPLGRVLECNSHNPRIIINLGSQDKVVTGLLFEVFQYDRGHYRTKGLVEVVEARPKISLCRVIDVADHKTWPLAENDYIGNPVFSKERPKKFVVAGDFNTFNRSDIEGFIRQTGAEVRDSLSPGTDFLVVPSNEYKGREMERAREFQVIAMDEAQILRFIRPEFKPKTSAPVSSR